MSEREETQTVAEPKKVKTVKRTLLIDVRVPEDAPKTLLVKTMKAVIDVGLSDAKDTIDGSDMDPDKSMQLAATMEIKKVAVKAGI